jgi:hypothetical protein
MNTAEDRNSADGPTSADDPAAAFEQSTCAVRRRHVIYVEGYDPIGADGYFMLFRRTCARFQKLWPASVALRRLEADSDDFAHWSTQMRGSEWRTTTHYDFLRLEGFIRLQMNKPSAWHLFYGLGWIAGDLLRGTQFRIFAASWRFALHLVHFQALLLAWAAVPAAIALIVGHGAARQLGSTPAGAATALAAFVALVLALRPFAEKWGASQIGSCWIMLRRYGRGQSTWLDRMVEIGARRLVAVAAAGACDELVVVGHSSGCVIASAMVARALALDPGLGRNGAALVLLTLGSVVPAVALDPAARRMRDIVRRLAVAPSLSWIDCHSRKDIMCFANFDPVAGVGIDVGPERRNPLLWGVRFRDMIAPENYGRFRWDHLRVHYQYVMAGERPAPYDFLLLIGGPAMLEQWPKHNRELMAAFIEERYDDAGRGRGDADQRIGRRADQNLPQDLPQDLTQDLTQVLTRDFPIGAGS